MLERYQIGTPQNMGEPFSGTPYAGVNEGETSDKWLPKHPIEVYNQGWGSHDRFHYGVYYCSQAMFMLGCRYWSQFYPTLANTLLENQTPAGHWQLETKGGLADGRFGICFTTSLAILLLTPPYQLLPIYQR